MTEQLAGLSALGLAWVVTIRYPDEEPEVAGVSVDRDEAGRYATWWNREEMRRYGPHSSVWALTEEIDFYPVGAWQPPARSHSAT
jgi:hypothetical protein